MTDPNAHDIHIAIIAGSVRPGNYTGKAAALVADELANRPHVRMTYVDPDKLDLPLPGRPTTGDVDQLNAIVADATGIIFATPEYHGSYSSVMKLILDNLDFREGLAGKPAALLGVAAGRIGAIKAMEHLRSVLSHAGMIVLPSPVSVPKCNAVFDEAGNCLDADMETTIRGLADKMLGFIHDHICPKLSLEQMVRDQGRD